MFNDLQFDLLVLLPQFLKVIIPIAIVVVILYFVIKQAIQKALEEYFRNQK